MKRLTQKDEQGNWCLKGVSWEQLHEGQVITKSLRERLYGALWKLMEYEDTGLTPEEAEELDSFERSQVGKMLKELNEEQRKHRWIPVEERLPEKDGVYLVTMVGEFVGDGNPFVGMEVFEDGTWYADEDDFRPVIAWMPLPEPYQPEE